MCEKAYWGVETPALKKSYDFKKPISAESYATVTGTEQPMLSTKATRSFKKGRLINILKNGHTEYTFVGHNKGGAKFLFTIREN